MKKLIPTILLTLLACASTGVLADPGQARVIIKCSKAGDDCSRKPAPAAPSAPRTATAPAPDQAGKVEVGMMAAPMMMGPPSLAAASMPPAPAMSAAPADLADVPPSAHAACATRKAGSKTTVELGPDQTLHGVCEKKNGKMRFRARATSQGR